MRGNVGERGLSNLVKLIEGLDGFRVGRLSSISRLKAYYEACRPLSLKRKWREVEGDLKEIIGLALKEPSLRKALRYNKSAESLYTFSVITTSIALIAFLMVKDPLVTFPIFLTLIVISNLALAMKVYAYRKITAFYAERRDSYKEIADRLRTDVNQLILELKFRLRRAKADPRKYKLKLRNVDYDNIEVLRKGRKDYEVLISLNGGPG